MIGILVILLVKIAATRNSKLKLLRHLQPRVEGGFPMGGIKDLKTHQSVLLQGADQLYNGFLFHAQDPRMR